MGHQFVLGNHEHWLFVTGHLIHTRDDLNLFGGEGRLERLDLGQPGAELADRHRRNTAGSRGGKPLTRAVFR
ncbi:MAG: hypothetical protein RLZ86_1966 [Actinomycetota bacterium]